MDALPFDSPPRRLFTAYPTRLTTWQDCARRYRFTYLEPKPKAGPWGHYSVGSSVHDALRRWYELPVDERTPQSAAGLVETGWIDAGFRDGEQSREALARARDWVRAYVATQDPTIDPAGLERSVATTTSILSVRGRVDRIDRRVDGDGAEELVVVDYKTSRRPSTEDETRTSLQLAMYAAATARTLRRPCTTVELHHVPSATIASWTYREGQLERHLARANEIGEEALTAETAWKTAGGTESVTQEAADVLFPASPGSRCSWCDVRSSCAEGRAVSVELKPWDAVLRSEPDAVAAPSA